MILFVRWPYLPNPGYLTGCLKKDILRNNKSHLMGYVSERSAAW